MEAAQEAADRLLTEFSAYDDDDQNLLDSFHYCELGTWASTFHPAYIEPNYLPTSFSDIVLFNLNITTLELVIGDVYECEQDLWTSEDFWTCLVVAAYQGKYSSDVDPDGNGPGDPQQDEDTDLGETYHDGDNSCLIYLETTTNEPMRYPDIWEEGYVVAHEIAHTSGARDHDGPHCLLKEGIMWPDHFCDNCILQFRRYSTWLSTNDYE